MISVIIADICCCCWWRVCWIMWSSILLWPTTAPWGVGPRGKFCNVNAGIAVVFLCVSSEVVSGFVAICLCLYQQCTGPFLQLSPFVIFLHIPTIFGCSLFLWFIISFLSIKLFWQVLQMILFSPCTSSWTIPVISLGPSCTLGSVEIGEN